MTPRKNAVFAAILIAPMHCNCNHTQWCYIYSTSPLYIGQIKTTCPVYIFDFLCLSTLITRLKCSRDPGFRHNKTYFPILKPEQHSRMDASVCSVRDGHFFFHWPYFTIYAKTDCCWWLQEDLYIAWTLQSTTQYCPHKGTV